LAPGPTQSQTSFRFAGSKIERKAMQGSNAEKCRSGKTNGFHNEAGLIVNKGVRDIISIHSLSIISGCVKAVLC
ncbi:MAG: hypothetical protein ACKPKO_44000, partial [Candidatus Fonsibacter sp.]